MARFLRVYGPGVYWSESWDTPDKTIPFQLYFYLLAMAEHLDARGVLEGAQAASLGQGMAEAGKDRKVKNAVRKLTREAFPEVE